jgi:hypothetical protein
VAKRTHYTYGVLKDMIGKLVGAFQSFKGLEETEIFHLSLIILIQY